MAQRNKTNFTITSTMKVVMEMKVLTSLCSMAYQLFSKLSDQWIVDSGATKHMCSDKSIFTNLHTLSCPLYVTLGD